MNPFDFLCLLTKVIDKQFLKNLFLPAVILFSEVFRPVHLCEIRLKFLKYKGCQNPISYWRKGGLHQENILLF